jgi:hypothetical protein
MQVWKAGHFQGQFEVGCVSHAGEIALEPESGDRVRGPSL